MRQTAKRSLIASCFAALLVLLTMWQNHRSVQAQGGVEAPATASSLGIWYGGTNFGTLTSAAASIVQPAPSITRARTTCSSATFQFKRLVVDIPKWSVTFKSENTTLLPSITGVDAGQQGNVTATGAFKLSSTNVPATASLMRSNANNNGTAVVTSVSISIFSVGTLHMGK